MTSRPKIILLLVVLVLVSAIAGACLGVRYGKAKARKRSNPQAWNVEAMSMLQRKLKLTPEQGERVRAVLDTGVVDLQAIRTETLARTDTVIARLTKEIDPILTEQQRPEFQKLIEERAKASLEMLNVRARPTPARSAQPTERR